MKKFFGMIFHRCVIVGFLMLLQLVLLFLMISVFQKYFTAFYIACVVLSLVVVIYIVNRRSAPEMKIAWIVPILLFPVFGGLFYLLFGREHMGRKEKERMNGVFLHYAAAMPSGDLNAERLRAENPSAALQSEYLRHTAAAPAFFATHADYYPLGEEAFARMITELNQAQHYIFLEFFIIQEGKMWNTILDILKRKVREGVDVRLIYDDFGCMFTLPGDYAERMEALGIRCCVFRKFTPVLSSRFNTRDHRKLCIIDGRVGFTGGINLADEYINAVVKHGHWKDNAIFLKGEAVWSLTAMFLAMWNCLRDTNEDFENFRPLRAEPIADDGCFQPFTDTPLDFETVGENMYINMITHAKQYVYLTTPYLAADEKLFNALSTAAKSGVDVRVVTPSNSDSRMVHAVTQSYYAALTQAGVRIYEYSPGFVHSKLCVCDDLYASVGTVNLDYRSLYLHYECAVWIYKSSAVAAIREDLASILAHSRQITLTECGSLAWYRRIFRSIIRLFAPLM